MKSALHPGAVEHYADANHYESRYAARREDVDYYLSKVKAGQRVLEYGAGAGRLSLPLAKKGVSVVAVDASEAMVTLLKQRVKEQAKGLRAAITVRRADMRRFRTGESFDVVIAAFHTLGHLYSNADIAAFLKLAWGHLEPGGRLIFDMPLPRIDMPEYDALAGVRVTEMDAPEGSHLLTQRWYQPAEMAMHLHYAGFERVSLRADFSNTAIDRDTSVYVVNAYRPKQSSAG